ncbi:glycosyltransferase [Actinacidiphila bryophytorum]|uniref:D-inositol 3-phosphate glycosyltransferase n=1 Tax=Actinacidiphila bryophytorum TaxID=1436133 RepID=A0A9W4MHZ0_9ACTN|nr:glycosyltransferase [Actinacidiphila bryophytorum]MBM9440808.1 glycosyltransferase [Actinacidiphila bryophytorum]MBN6545471.1 glycosyltransferase [Actinacidiphila bryophytorum]CAG7657396.1 Glycosyltransferase involved in cell wall bisynthesis [Actinacidiphila bryophytorum]
MRIVFLLHNAYGIGGTIRTVCNLAGALAAEHDVEVASVFRSREVPAFDYDPRVRLRPLADLRAGNPARLRDDPRAGRPSAVFPRGDRTYAEYSALTDDLIGGYLAGLDADVVVGTRPGLNVHIARQAPRRLVRVAQEHLTLDTHSTRLTLALRRRYAALDAVTTTTQADAAVYRRRMPGIRAVGIPNGVPSAGAAVSDGSAPVVVAAGRLSEAKRYDDLVRAFATVAAARPDWTLRLYGKGDKHAALAALIAELGLGEHVRLMGTAAPIEPELAKGSILAVTSSMESFGMTIVEGMRAGLPVVATDCPLGPREIVRDGVTGLLVPPRDVPAIAAALLELIGDGDRRREMGRAALAEAAAYDPALVAERHVRLFAELLEARRRPAAGARAAVRATATRTAGAVPALLDAAGAAGRAAAGKARRRAGGR